MTRLRSDSSTTDDESVTNCNIVPNGTFTSGRSNTQGQVQGAVVSDSHNNYNISTNSDSEENGENFQDPFNHTLRLQQYAVAGELEDRESEHNYLQPGDETTTTTTTSDDEERSGYYNAQDSPRLLEQAVYEFALSSARRLTIGHDLDYDLRPNFAILKPKTEELDNICNSNNPSQQPLSTQPQTNCNNTNRTKTYPKTPDWFFNIPDTRSPFPEFESKLLDETEQ